MSEKKTSSLSIVIPLLLVIALVVGAGLYISKGKVEENYLDAQLAAYAQKVAQMGDADSGLTFGLYYDPVEVADTEEGRVATIRNMRYRQQQVDESGTISASAEYRFPELTVTYDLLELSEFTIAVKESVTLEMTPGFSPEADSMTLHPKGDLRAQLTAPEGDAQKWRVQLELPNEGFAIDLGEQRAGNISYAADPVWELFVDAADMLPLQQTVLFEDFAISTENFPLSLVAKKLALTFEGKSLQQGMHALDYAIALEDVTFGGVETPLLPASLFLEASYEGMIAKSVEELQEVLLNKPLYTNLRKGALTFGATEFEFSGVLENEGGAFLPNVDMQIDVREFAPFYQTLNEQGTVDLEGEVEVLAELMMQKIVGIPLSEVQDASIVIQREKGSAFRIGETTFEELVALWLTQKMSKSGQFELREQDIEDAFDNAEQE